MCKCICSAANMHPSMKHLTMLRAGLLPFFFIFLFLFIWLVQNKITCFSPLATDPLGTLPCLLNTLLHLCLSCLLLWTDCPNSQVRSQVAGRGLYHSDNMTYFISFFFVFILYFTDLLLLLVCWGTLESKVGNKMAAVD